MREGCAFAAFTQRGEALAEKLRALLGGTLRPADVPLADWTAVEFPKREALIFVGAAGIAVRSVAPHIRSKAEDPAVLCLDETGRFVIPLLSGHLGGANALASRIAALTGGTAVVTTATDINGLFAVDLWAKKQGLQVLRPERIREISAAVLRGENAALYCPRPVAGETPAHVRLTDSPADAAALVSYRREETDALQLVPRVLTLGIGCRRGTEAETLERELARFCDARGVLPEAIVRTATIDLKRDEAGLSRFCERHGWALTFYSAEALREVPGSFTPSRFVEARTGVDNVCERAAVLRGGTLVEKKYAANGVTFALAEAESTLDWSW